MLAWLTPDAPEGFCILTIALPDCLVPMLEGAIAQLANEDNWEVVGNYPVEQISQDITIAMLQQVKQCASPIVDDMRHILVDDLGRMIVP